MQATEPSGADSRALQSPHSMSLADLVASDEDEDDSEHQQQIAQSLSLLSDGSAPQGRPDSADDGPLDLTALEMLSDLPELMGGLGVELATNPTSGTQQSTATLVPSEAPSQEPDTPQVFFDC